MKVINNKKLVIRKYNKCSSLLNNLLLLGIWHNMEFKYYLGKYYSYIKS